VHDGAKAVRSFVSLQGFLLPFFFPLNALVAPKMTKPVHVIEGKPAPFVSLQGFFLLLFYPPNARQVEMTRRSMLWRGQLAFFISFQETFFIPLERYPASSRRRFGFLLYPDRMGRISAASVLPAAKLIEPLRGNFIGPFPF
jgi:hypothetical protein